MTALGGRVLKVLTSVITKRKKKIGVQHKDRNAQNYHYLQKVCITRKSKEINKKTMSYDERIFAWSIIKSAK